MGHLVVTFALLCLIVCVLWTLMTGGVGHWIFVIGGLIMAAKAISSIQGK